MGYTRPFTPAKQIHHSRAFLRIADRRDVTLRLVQENIGEPLLTLQQLAIHADMIDLRIRLAAEFRHGRAVHLHVAGGDQLLGLAPRSNSGRSNDLL